MTPALGPHINLGFWWPGWLLWVVLAGVQAVFAADKLTGQVGWSWWAVLIPVWVAGLYGLALAWFMSVTEQRIGRLEDLTDVIDEQGDLLGLLKAYAITGVEIDGSHHKQWALIEIGRHLGVTWDAGSVEEGIAP